MTNRPQDKLNSRQRAFCVNLASGMSQNEAYTRAGYNSVLPGPQATKLLQNNAYVQAYYQQLVERRDNLALAKVASSILSPHEVKALLSELARADLTDFIDKDGQPSLDKDTPNRLAAKGFYKKKRKDRNGNIIEVSEVKLSDKVEALRELARIYGMHAPSRHLVGKQVVIDIIWEGKQ